MNMAKTPAASAPVNNAPITVNDICIAKPDENLTEQVLRQRACSELLRQGAIKAGLLACDDPIPVDGILSEIASQSVEVLLMQAITADTPDEATCRRYYDGHKTEFKRDERVKLRHILFAVTPGLDVNRIRQHAQGYLIDLRSETDPDRAQFGIIAKEVSNCPSGAIGGDLGWLDTTGCAPEIAQEIFGKSVIGVFSTLVRSRFGLHIIEVLERQAGWLPPYEHVSEAVTQVLKRRQFTTALSKYLHSLANHAKIDGLQLYPEQGAESPTA